LGGRVCFLYCRRHEVEDAHCLLRPAMHGVDDIDKLKETPIVLRTGADSTARAGKREPRPRRRGALMQPEMRLVTASAVRWGRGLVAGAAVVAAGAASRVTEGGADRRREREACKHTRDYLAPGELHALPPFPPQLSACRLTQGARDTPTQRTRLERAFRPKSSGRIPARLTGASAPAPNRSGGPAPTRRFDVRRGQVRIGGGPDDAWSLVLRVRPADGMSTGASSDRDWQAVFEETYAGPPSRVAERV